ncbi:hypothetical protein SAMN06272735_6558 [Streptomyces sp. TLI_55]|uniref:DUF6114 domain-containing protein n=1 Tax=Streptomyces sp. TLI_55 TaxID=1938861 RepID=UPI000BD7F77C|nr:DUF6114 domain-containing protein [Streptomyces sp. TLI_55]SNX64730.1 hypothetical protein SAMN06272735_6558 [Streptomyces sp. TLI_55]
MSDTDTPRRGVRSAFHAWRADRPFWGGLLLALGGAEILLTEKASLKVVLHIGMQGLAGYLLPALMLLLGLLILFNPTQRLFYSITGVLLALGTWLTSNLGGFFIGLLLGVVGSCLAFGWLPDQEPRVSRRKRREAARAAKTSATLGPLGVAGPEAGEPA